MATKDIYKSHFLILVESSLLIEPEKLQDYFDFLHMQTIKQADVKRFSLEEVKLACNL